MTITHSYQVCPEASTEYLFHDSENGFSASEMSELQSIALKLICLSGQSVYEYHGAQNKNNAADKMV